jgi:hypothetical protein
MTTEKYMTMAAFARHVGVTKVTVLTWKKRGHLVFGPDRKHLDVAKSIECLKARPTKFRGGETKGPRNGADAARRRTRWRPRRAGRWPKAQGAAKQQWRSLPRSKFNSAKVALLRFRTLTTLGPKSCSR